jgi:hypothetical protein
MKQVAAKMEVELEPAVKTLKQRYPAYAATETQFFQHWNECALEKLRYIRDESNGEVTGYAELGCVFR